jgi:ABC-type amino acid transport substrate-binding protein
VGTNEERKKYLSFTEPYLSFPRVVLSRKNGVQPSSLKDLAGLLVGVQENSSHHGWLRENTDLQQPVLYPTAQEALLALSNGDVQAVIGNLAASSYAIRKLALDNLQVAFPLPGGSQALAFAVRNDWPEMVSILNKTLAAIAPQKAMAIRRKWAGLAAPAEGWSQLKLTAEERGWLDRHPVLRVSNEKDWPPMDFPLIT